METVHRKSKGVLVLRTPISRNNQKLTQCTTVLYSKYVCNTKNYFLPEPKNSHNATTVLYSKYVSNTKTYFPPEIKKLTQQHNWKKVPPTTRSECICSSVCHSVRPSVRAEKGIQSKSVFMRTNGNFSFSMR